MEFEGSVISAWVIMRKKKACVDFLRPRGRRVQIARTKEPTNERARRHLSFRWSVVNTKKGK